MSESEEERRLRKEKKREAARRAAEKEAKQQSSNDAAAKTASAAAPATQESEEERRLRKEKKRAQREAAKKLEEAEAAAAAAASSAGKSKEEERAARKARKEAAAAAAAAAASTGDAANDATAEPAHHHHHHHHNQNKDEATTAAVEAPKKATKPKDDNADLLRAIEAENNAVASTVAAAAQTSARGSASAAPAGQPADGQTNESRPETEEERAARKQAEREERRRQRHAAKAAAAAAAAAGTGGVDVAASADGSPGGGAASAREKRSTAASPAGPSPTTAFDPSTLQRQAYRVQFQRDLARATALRRLVDFDSSGGVVLDLAPQTAYDLYIRDFGQSGREQAGVQAPPEEERLDAATQAERGRLRTRGAQAPDDLGLCPEEEAERQFFQLRRSAMQRSGKADAASGTAEANNNNADADNNNNIDENNTNASGAKRAVRSVDAGLLERFLTGTLPLMSAVLDENNASAKGAAAAAVAAAAGDGASGSGGGKSRGSTAISSTYTTFCWRGTRNRPLVQVLLNPSNTRQLIALHGTREESGPSPVLDAYMSVLLLWNVHDTTTPERVLVSFSAVMSVCVSPSRPHLIYGGTEDGNVCVWSLREPDRLHLAAGRFERVVFHLPSYSTSWQADGHGAPVRQVRVSGYNAKTPARKEEHEQLASMDERGVVCFWSVTDKESSGKASQVIDNDYGQHPFTSVSLHLAKGTSAGQGMESADMAAHTAADANSVAYSAGVTSSFDFAPLDGSQYVLTAPHGVVRRSRFGGIAVPSLYSPSQATYYFLAGEKTSTSAKGNKNINNGNMIVGGSGGYGGGAQGIVAVPCCVQYNVLDPRWFVVGYEDGTLRLFLHNEATPKLTVEVGYQPIVAVRCSGTTPWVVWALDEGGEVHMIDFAHHGRQTPRVSHALTQPDTGVCTCMDISTRDEKADQRMLVAGFEKGMVQLHTLDTEKLRVANAERDEKWI